MKRLMTKGVLLVVVLLVVTTRAVEPEKCQACNRVFTAAYTNLKAKDDADTVEAATDVLDALCDQFQDTTFETYCRELIVDSETDFAPVIVGGSDVADICIAAKQCGTKLAPPPAAPVAINEGNDVTDDVLNMFHRVGKDSGEAQRRAALNQQSNLQMQQFEQVAQSMAPTINVAAPPPVGGGSGLAWDKHDMDVTKNKGGDVEVEVNLAAPIGGIGMGGIDGEDMASLVEAMQQQEPDTDNSDQFMEVMRQMQMQMNQPAIQMQQFMQNLLFTLKDVTRQQPALPAPPQAEAPVVIEAIHPAPQAAPPPVDMAALMREMREALAAGKSPPPPPPGIDPALLDFLKQTLKELKDMRKDQQQPPQPTPPPPTPTEAPETPSSPPPQQQPIVLPAPPAEDAGLTMEDVQEMMQKMYKPPSLPSFPAQQDDDLDALRAMLAAHMQSSAKPIVLPPPAAAPTEQEHGPIAPPPPPPPPVGDNTRDELMNLIKQSTARPQRIPAPPVIRATSPPTACCMPPNADQLGEEVSKCPKIKGVALPRCKRKPPSLPANCKRSSCRRGPVLDADGDVDIEATQTWQNLPPCEGAGCGDTTLDNFDPKSLLAALSDNNTNKSTK